MLFNSYIFLFVFLPLVFAGFSLLCDQPGRSLAKAWLMLCSLYFYSWFKVGDIWIIIGSVLVNFTLARAIAANRMYGRSRQDVLFGFGVVTNLAMLGYYKYTGFFLSEVLPLVGVSITPPRIVLPLGISFFTFQQIIFLRDIRNGTVTRFSFLDYMFCVTFFPHLIAGPIIKYKTVLTQLASRAFFTLSSTYMAAGFCWLTIGLCKKVLIADMLAPYADTVFHATLTSASLDMATAWAGSLAYTFQIYFDFSGYSDIAIGLALLFKIELPVNFDSPYKSRSIMEFWRRWHITLSWFLRECIYIPLGGNRRGTMRQYLNLALTMLLGGLWHGAGWGFILWGLVHGLALVVVHAWRRLRGGSGLAGPVADGMAMMATFLTTSAAWVLFRAETLPSAGRLFLAMLGFSAPEAGTGPMLSQTVWLWLGGCLALCWFAPNTQQIMGVFRPRLEHYLTERESVASGFLLWRPTVVWAILLGMFFIVIGTNLSGITNFVYFQF